MVYGLMFYLALIEDADAAEYFKYIYVKYQRPMYQSAMAILHNHEKAEDAVHDAFFKLASKDERLAQVIEYKYTDEEGYYLIMMSKQCALNMLDSATERYEELCDFDGDLAEKYCDDPNFTLDEDLSEQIIDQRDFRELKLAIGYLPPEYSNLIMMLYYYNFSLEQIMEDTGWDKQTIYVKKYRGLKRLQMLLSDIKRKGIFKDE